MVRVGTWFCMSVFNPAHNKDWRTEIIMFLQDNVPTDDKVWVKRMEARTRPYKIIEEKLFKEGMCSPLLKCQSRTYGQELMKEIHLGICQSHIWPRAFPRKVFRNGFYWSKTTLDATDLVRKCGICQRCVKDQMQPSPFTQLMQPTRPLQRWGMDISTQCHWHGGIWSMMCNRELLQVDWSKGFDNYNFGNNTNFSIGRTLYAGSMFQSLYLWIMVLNLTPKSLCLFVARWAQIYTLHLSGIQNPIG